MEQSLQDLFVDELRDLLSVENQIIKALPKMVKAAESTDLQTALQNHLKQTEGQVQRLEQIFEQLGEKARSKTCKGMQGIIEEGKEMISESEGPTRDALLIGAAQKVEHYEIAGYGTARTFAQLLGHKEAAKLLQQTLDEEKQADLKLSQLAESHINLDAKESAQM